ncbi:triple tyrosine motif-containing protein [Clostridium sp. BSD9I1]|uniref:triple tyrosine motif-containing protein n=1 Tax=Clostridium sp. BSD9I1 TaxID=2003589 RepID=UPI0016482C53|nr:triple tyrosine motif-containing protein [Clostridium sp. BSD9I1]
MNEISITFSVESPREREEEIIIKAEVSDNDNLLYKFFVGCNGIWEVLRDFDYKNNIKWVPKEDGKYTIMVQAKVKDSTKPFEYLSRSDFIIGKSQEKIIDSLKINKKEIKVGEKIKIDATSNKDNIMYRYWLKEEFNWQIIKDYTLDNFLECTIKNPGKHEILVECKEINSLKQYNDFARVDFNVLPLKKIEIRNFRCITGERICNEELLFEVDTDGDKDRVILYKFIKISKDREFKCIQDYSTKKVVAYVEEVPGDYRLICMVKDMYSPKEYDDRAIINFSIHPYKNIEINSFTANKMSPQRVETEIELQAIVTGGRELLYRYIIEGNSSVDSGYIRLNNYTWKPEKPGEYKVILWVKDSSFDGEYEQKEEVYFTVDEKVKLPIKIENVIIDKGNEILKHEEVIIEVNASGSSTLRYSFIIRKEGQERGRIDYGSCNFIKFTPQEEGKFEIEVMVKDKYSLKEYDSHKIIYINSYNFFPANIDYILMPLNEYYVAGDTIKLNIISINTKDLLFKYVLKINGRKIEETDYVESIEYYFMAPHSGVYVVEIYVKNKLSNKEFDNKKEARIPVHQALPITNTTIKCSDSQIEINKPIIVTVENEGGKDVIYEFYLMEEDEWFKVQNYSKKNYYSFVPFKKGKYRILALCKSSYRKCAYEDYDILEFII